MARGLPHRGLRRLPDRSPCPPRRDHRNRRGFLPSQRSTRTLRETRASTPRSQTIIAEQPKSPHGLPLPINFKIPAYWTPEQALAVFELLDDLRDQIGAHYSVQTPQSEGPQTGPFRISTTRRRIMYGSSPPATRSTSMPAFGGSRPPS